MSRSSKCEHLRQRRLPCAQPGCRRTIPPDEFVANMITPGGVRRGYCYEDRDIPDQFKAPVTWTRQMYIPEAEAATEPIFFWYPSEFEELGRKFFDSGIALFCPGCHAFLGVYKIFKKSLQAIARCPNCRWRLKPKYEGDKKIDWFRAVGGEFIGTNAGITIVELPE